uniref:non-specific serine/threonine protein kinase n=1 Tax=Setaria digitata TaxID=48799 RepID=A0A915Q2A4_9BILA
MRKTRIRTWGETFYRSHFNRLIKLRNISDDNDNEEDDEENDDDESDDHMRSLSRMKCCSIKQPEKAITHPASDNPFMIPSPKIKPSSRCRALILSPLRLIRVFTERKKLYQKNKIEPADNTSKASISIGDKNNYRIGEGSFGAVFRYVYNNRVVAIKQLHHSRHSSSSDFQSFCSELNAFRLPPSPYVVQAIAFTSSGICMQIVTEFIEGKNLQQLINDDAWHVTILQRLQLAFQVISGLVHCHQHLLLHLDVKPANVIVHINEKICKLSDFGCSRTAAISGNDILMINDERRSAEFGTISYKAPELFKGQKVTDRADIYSFSIVLWELLTRETVHNCIHPHIFIYGVVVRKLRPKIEQLNLPKGRFGRALISLLESCWSDDLTKRPRALIVQQIIKEIICNSKLKLTFS